jgi:hypothetical protein
LLKKWRYVASVQVEQIGHPGEVSPVGHDIGIPVIAAELSGLVELGPVETVSEVSHPVIGAIMSASATSADALLSRIFMGSPSAFNG